MLSNSIVTPEEFTTMSVEADTLVISPSEEIMKELEFVESVEDLKNFPSGVKWHLKNIMVHNLVNN